MIDRLPKSVRIGPYDFEIVQWRVREGAARSRYGECSTQELILRVEVEQLPLIKIANTLLHEIMHAIDWIWCRDHKDDEERVVNMHANGLTTVWRDNPELFAWIYEAITGR